MAEQVYRTRELYFAGYLMVQGVTYLGVEPLGDGSGLSMFLFEEPERCEELKRKWTNGQDGGFSQYAEKVIRLKKECHQGRGR